MVRYIMNLEEIDREHLWHPYTQMQEMLDRKIRIIDRAEGFHLIDIEGNRYIDGVASMWCNVWGHNRVEIINTIKEQINNLTHSSLFGLSNDKAILLAERLSNLTGMDKVFYANDGSSAVEVAIKIAVQYWKNIGEKRDKIIALKNGYHGDTIGSMSVGYVEQFFSNYKQLLFNVKHVDSPYMYRKSKDMSDRDYINYCLDAVEKELK
ncbi:MAG: aspartate aminotransferase family protein, partial [Candidatus Nitrosothermus koennekii]